MPTRFDLPHIDISAFVSSSGYSGQGSGGSSAVRVRAVHGAKLQNELSAAFAAMDADRFADERLLPTIGSYVEVELRRGGDPDGLTRKKQGIKSTAVKDGLDGRLVALYVPDHARGALDSILSDYRSGQLTKAGKPPKQASVEPVEAFRRARLETLWTDDIAALPIDPQHEMWWSVWIERGNENELENICGRLSLRAANRDRRLYFPELVVVPVFATRAAIELMMFATGVICELRRATDNPVFYMEDVRETQHEWSDNLAARIEWPGADVPSICLLDTGVNRGHALLEPAIAPADMQTYNVDWLADDHHGHGTAMAGIALHGDLVAQLADTATRVLSHRLESVKLLPPRGMDANSPNSYGTITQAAVAMPEITSPARGRVYCMAISNAGVSGAQPSTWSSAIDQAAAGAMIGDDAAAPKRLFVLSIGNTDPVFQMSQWAGQDAYPAEDPAQAWNALTVGGYTDLNTISDEGYETWTTLSEVGELSPHSRTSVGWTASRSPFKPELVLEAGNRAVSPARREILSLESLKLLSTGKDVDQLPLVPFDGSSAAAALAARCAARLMADHPDYWPEMVRALMVHSGEYTAPMKASFNSHPSLRDRYALVRRFGYGVPDFERATASARDHLALVAQSEIQPFRMQGGRKFNECHYYRLPLPNEILETLNNELVDLKITLSYFVEPNPGLAANVDPQRYQSFGLRFDLQRKNESAQRFKQRVNLAERENPQARLTSQPDDSRWLLGPDSISAGSLHCDTWSGPAIDLLGRDTLCIKPVGGWWRDRARPEIVNRNTRYALVVTLKGQRTDIDFYTPINLLVQSELEVVSSIEI